MKNKILLIDDEKEILNVYERIFEPEEKLSSESLEFLDFEDQFGEELMSSAKEFEVIKCTSGMEGVEQAKLNPDIKVAFIDMRMPPGINGAETAKLIREINPKIEIVIVTAYSDINLSEIVEIVGKPDKLLYLRKPFASEEIEQLALNLVTKYDSSRVKERLVANISHEMKTPLSVISGYCSILSDEIKQDEHCEYLDIIQKSSSDLQSLIDSLLLLTEVGEDNEVSKNYNCDLMDVFEIVGKSIRSLEHKYPNINFTKEVKAENIKLACSSLKMSYAITNLIDNAFKFTVDGEVSLNVSVDDNELKISVTDNGIGIADDQKDFVFDKFYRVEDAVHTEPGFGLGLTNSRYIVESLNGAIELESKLKLGTTVNLKIPVLR